MSRAKVPETPRGPVLKKLFKLFDENGDGEIDETEGLKIGRTLAGGSVEAAQKFWSDLKEAADTDHSNTVSLDEYLAYSRKQTESQDVDRVVTSLNASLARLEEAHAREQQQNARAVESEELDRTGIATRIFRFLDTNNDGVVELHELLKLAKSDKDELENLPNSFIIADMEGFRKGDGKLTLEDRC